MSVYVPPRRKAADPSAEAIDAIRRALKAGPVGPGAGVLMTEYLMPMMLPTDPQRKIRMALSVGAEVSWIRAAERVISGKIGGDPDLTGAVKWHLEDPDGDTIDEDYPDERAVEAYILIREPAKYLGASENGDAVLEPTNDVQLTVAEYQGELWEITSRHMGLAGQGYWYLDGLNEFGIPQGLLYVRPDRMFPRIDKDGNLTGWALDPRNAVNLDTGTLLELKEVIQFPLEAPGHGFIAPGLIESCILKAQLSGHIDKYLGSLLGNSGKLQGMFAPKGGAIEDDGTWDQLQRDMRNIAEQPDAAKRMQLMRGPMEYTRTQATIAELAIVELLHVNRDDLLALWGVPLSQVGGSSPAGLNSGDIRKYDEAALWQNAIVMRLVPLKQRIQRRLLDRWKPLLGWAPKLVLDIPEFDDDSPRYDKIQKAMNIAMTNDERRKMIGKDPIPAEVIGPTGIPLGAEVWMPNAVSPLGIAPTPAPTQTVAAETTPAWSAYASAAAASAVPGQPAPGARTTDGIPGKSPEKPSTSTMAGMGGMVPAGGAGATLKAKPDPQMVTEAVLAALRKQWPESELEIVRKGDWRFDPEFPVSKVNAARRPIARNPKIVAGVLTTLEIGAPIDPVTLIHTKVIGTKGWEPIDGWHRMAAAEKAGLKTVPAYLGEGDAEWTKELIAFDDDIPTPPDSAGQAVSKAKPGSFRAGFLALRQSVGSRVEPQVRTAVSLVLASQRADIAKRVRTQYEALKANPRDTSLWWPTSNRWDESMASALEPGLRTIANEVRSHVRSTLPAKASPLIQPAISGQMGPVDPRAVAYVLDRSAARVVNINRTTREALQSIIAEGIDEGMGAGELGQAILGWTGFSELRAETIARTETGEAYNAAALDSYREFGVEEVHVTDGDEDEECAPWSDWTGPIDEAPDELGHPNCTRDFEPVVTWTAEDYQTAADLFGGE